MDAIHAKQAAQQQQQQQQLLPQPQVSQVAVQPSPEQAQSLSPDGVRVSEYVLGAELEGTFLMQGLY